MPRLVRLSPKARDDLRAIRTWYSQPGSSFVAKRRVQAILSAITRLKDNPCLHPHGDDPSIRRLTVERHVVIYEVHPDTGRTATAGDVLVLRVFGPGQDRSP